MHPIVEAAMDPDADVVALVEQFYGPDGPLAQAGWEIRAQQREMSLDIAQAYEAREAQSTSDRSPTWVVHEAPCGTGKGLAYLVPGFLACLRDRAVWNDQDPETRGPPPQFVISTANIALQEQLMKKDIPALADMLDTNIQRILLKGRNNYACFRAMAAVDGETHTDPNFARLLDDIRSGDWDGDRETMTWDPGRLWNKVSVTSDRCAGRGCPHFALQSENLCFWRRAVHGWQRAHVVVVNHHLLALRSALRASILAVDEMHELENAVRGMVSESLTAGTGRSLANRAKRWLGDEAYALLADPVEAIMRRMEDQFWEENPEKTRYPNPVVFGPGWADGSLDRCPLQVQSAYEQIRDLALEHGAVEVYEGYLEPPSAHSGDPDEVAEASSLALLGRILFRLVQRVRTFATGEPDPAWPGGDAPWAIFAEGSWNRDELKLVAKAAPSDVSWALSSIQARYPVAAFTSATVPETRNMALTYGMEVADIREDDDPDPEPGEVSKPITTPWIVEKRLPSPYDLEHQGVTIVPDGPRPTDRNWRDWAADKVIEAVQLSGGGALVLASSRRQMLAYAERLRSWLPDLAVKVQGDEGRTNLRDWFGAAENGVLVATRSFFQGVDIKGNACRLVIIDRIPFATATDPIEAAVQKLLVARAGGGSGYMLRSVPEAAMQLAQGSGRLIRSPTDHGALVVLDNRIRSSKGGWKKLKQVLPPFPFSTEIADVENIINRRPLVGVPIVRARTIKHTWS